MRGIRRAAVLAAISLGFGSTASLAQKPDAPDDAAYSQSDASDEADALPALAEELSLTA